MERQTRNTFEVKNCHAKEFFLRFCFASQHSENKVALLERRTRSASVNSGGRLCAQSITPSPRYSGEREGVRGPVSKGQERHSQKTPHPNPLPRLRWRGGQARHSLAKTNPPRGAPDVPQCSRVFQGVPKCSEMFRDVPKLDLTKRTHRSGRVKRWADQGLGRKNGSATAGE